MISFLDYNRYTFYKYFFRLQKFGWKLMGFWIGSDVITKIQFCFLLFNCFEALAYGVFQLHYLYSVRGNLIKLFDALTPFSTTIPSVIRVLFVVRSRKEIKKVLDYLKAEFTNVKDIEEKKLLGVANRFSTVMLTLLIFFGYLTAIYYMFVPACVDIYLRIYGLERQFGLPFKATFPFEHRFFPVYEIVYFLGFYSCHITMAAVTGNEGLFFGLCTQLSAQFEIVSLRLEKLMESEIGKIVGDHENIFKLAEKQNERIQKRLTGIIKMQNEIIEKCEIISKELWQNLLSHLVISSVIICIASLMVMNAEGFDRLVFIFYISAYVVQIFIYCACGNMLIDSSLKVSEAAYNFPWYKCNVKVRKTILMIIMRSQRKVEVKVPFFDVSYETFGWVMRLGGSFITFIKTFL